MAFPTGLNEVTSSINETAGHNKALIEQMKTDLHQLIDEYNYGKADGTGEELQGIKEHLMDLENRANGTSLALNDLSAGIYNELRAKQASDLCNTADLLNFKLIAISVYIFTLFSKSPFSRCKEEVMEKAIYQKTSPTSSHFLYFYSVSFSQRFATNFRKNDSLVT